MADNSIAAQIRARFQALREQKEGGDANEPVHKIYNNREPVETPTPPVEAEGAGICSSRADKPSSAYNAIPNSAQRIRTVNTPTPPADSGGAGTNGSERENESIPNIAEPAAKSTNGRLRYALAYARRGFRVFQCHHIESDRECSCGKLQCSSAGKHPRNKGWQAEATTDEATIRQWWEQEPDANIGVACGRDSGLTVLDVDGIIGRETLRELELEHGELPETPIVLTGSGGNHYYFGYEPEVGNAVRFAQGLDIRTQGGLVVGVGSKTKRQYEWEAVATIGEVAPAKMPRWLVEAILAAQAPKLNGSAVIVPDKPLGAGEGRNNLLYRLGRSNKAKGFPQAAIRSSLEALNATFNPPLDLQELDTLIVNVCSEPDRPGFQPPSTVSAPVSVAITISWENYDLAIAANEAYLARTPVVDKLCYSSAVSMITGGKHAGKSTLARWMAMCVAKGWPFLKREVVQGPVVYIASEDETMPARQELLRLGWQTTDPIHFLSASNAPVDDRVKLLEAIARDIKSNRVGFVVFDMLFDFVDIRDEMSYAGTREAVGRIQNVASETGAHIVVIHHAPKHSLSGDAAVTALGSQGLAARVSPIILVRRFGPGVHSIVSTSVRDPRGEALGESRLFRHEDGSVSLGGAWKVHMLSEAYNPRILEFIEAEEGAEVTASDIATSLDIPYEVSRACLSSLYKSGDLKRSGEGKKGKPFRYTRIPPTSKNGGYLDVSASIPFAYKD